MTIDRRGFIGSAIAAGAGITALSGRNAAANAASSSSWSFELAETTIRQLSDAMAKGELTSVEIVSQYLERIDKSDGQLKSVVETDPDALDIARRLDEERRDKKSLGPLHGIPVLIKENIETADKMKTTAGSLALLGAPTPKKDAFIVEQLSAAGAVIIGKTNLSEWANFRSSRSISGWSGRGGQTRNPYILDRTPCGSSSGTGAGISANMAAVGIGTETDGSIICPSSNCGLVGIKPTVGLVSRSGIIPLAHSQDTAGPMTRTVEDAAIMLDVLDAVDARDAATTERGKRERSSYTLSLRRDGLKGARIGVVRSYWGRRPEVDAVMDAALDAMRSEGAVLTDIQIPTLGKFGDSEYKVLLYEFKNDLEKYLKERGAEHSTLDELIQFNTDNAAREMPYFKQEIFEEAAKLGPLTDDDYVKALADCREKTQKQGIDAVADANRLDAIVAPSNAPAWMIDTINGDCGSGYISSSSIAAVAGYPNITVPAGFSSGLPLGISFFGKAFTEHKLISIAYAFEQATKARRQPTFLQTAG